MSHVDGDMQEMPSPTLDDRALEALLSGTRSVPAGFDWLVPFVEVLGDASSQSAPVVRPALALLLAEGFSPETARPAPVGRVRRSRLAGRIVAGLGLALAGTTAAGAAGILPDPAQHAVATVVQAATPFTFPDAAGFGATVSKDATGASDGEAGVDGPAVSDAARDKAPGPAAPGATGLDRANETPAAGHAPTSVPSAAAPANAGGPPADAGSQSSNGLGTAATTPAAGRVPSTVPAVTRPSTPGQGGAADGTPATTRPPASLPPVSAPGRP